ncbi:Sec-independent protein translocase protein TatCd [Halobacillus andaensis]|uniref:Sec-independent protein translocase protein TatC n=1 Tax=Halobacillus andaensis TaxID=1176239 RepID=A0A917B7E6_HALAA|nr:twin-arginine translocase subunit TatC [Halobacillus andaensis]MBP2006464.1 sec-independent protein translocase protein TatC [Halobacillus andaensis]GGF27574.1 Sec-independent protein translocase protein TatCd [Halobacillus andaensis]
MEEKNLQLVGHLEELRKRIIITLLSFVAFLIGGFVFVRPIYRWLIKDLDAKLAVLGPGDILWVYLMIAAVIALAATIPVAAFQVWLFVKPALNQEERKVTLQFIPALFFLFLFGISFGYFLLFPLVLGFLTSLSDGQFEMMFTADKYFRFLLNLTVPFGLLFEMPLVIMFLTRLGILNPIRLKKARKIAYFILVVISVLITPPDFLSDVLVIVPLFILYEISISLSTIVYRRKLAAQNAEEKTVA